MKVIYTEKIVKNIIDECDPEGDVYKLFDKYQKSEKELRGSFESPLKNAEEVLDRIYMVNSKYNTRYKKENIPRLAEIIFKRLKSEGFLQNEPPNLASDSKERFAEYITQILKDLDNEGLHKPYSLVTKFHHFSFPNSFVMYDQWVARSIQMWAYFSFEDRSNEYENFTYERIAHSSGAGYQGMLDFYVNLFKVAPAGMAEVGELSNKLTNKFGFRISALDLVDKFLWNCEGDPKWLGFLE